MVLSMCEVERVQGGGVRGNRCVCGGGTLAHITNNKQTNRETKENETVCEVECCRESYVGVAGCRVTLYVNRH